MFFVWFVDREAEAKRTWIRIELNENLNNQRKFVDVDILNRKQEGFEDDDTLSKIKEDNSIFLSA